MRGAVVETELLSHGLDRYRIVFGVPTEILHGLHGFAHGLGDRRSYALRDRLRDQLSHHRIVLKRRLDSALVVALPPGSVQQGVGTDQVEDRREVAPQADGGGGHLLCQGLRVRDQRPRLARREPCLKGGPAPRVGRSASSFARLLSISRVRFGESST
jgi:hypothetical protein